MRLKWVTILSILIGSHLSGCALSGVAETCDGPGDACSDSAHICHDAPDGKGFFCAPPCVDDTACDANGLMECRSRRCVFKRVGGEDDDDNLLPDPTCADNEVRCGDDCVEAVPTDNGYWLPNTIAHCGDCNVPSPTGRCVNGVALGCENDAACEAPENGSARCNELRNCIFSCDEGYDDCEPGLCVSLKTTKNCGECGVDVSAYATSCIEGRPLCGQNPICDPPDVCVPTDESGLFACAECGADMDCPESDFCCEGQCRPRDRQGEFCGCSPTPRAPESASSYFSCEENQFGPICIAHDDTPACGCDADVDTQDGRVDMVDQCGQEQLGDVLGYFLANVCNTKDASCEPQSPSRCGKQRGVRSAPSPHAALADDTSATCDVRLGGSLCLPDDNLIGRCGCAQNRGDCSQIVRFPNDPVPHRISDGCSDDVVGPEKIEAINPPQCGCVQSPTKFEPCPAERPDCFATSGGCFDLRTDVNNCGELGESCPDGSSCVHGGCSGCSSNADCSVNAAADSCTQDGGLARCSCAAFTQNFDGDVIQVACPMGWTCTNTGCIDPDTSEIYTTMQSIPSL